VFSRENGIIPIHFEQFHNTYPEIRARGAISSTNTFAIFPLNVRTRRLSSCPCDSVPSERKNPFSSDAMNTIKAAFSSRCGFERGSTPLTSQISLNFYVTLYLFH